MGAIEHPPILSLAPLGVPDHVFYAWIVMAILIAVSVAATRNLQLAPRGLQNFMEVVLEQFLTLLDEVIGHDGRRYLPLIATLGLFILTSNLLGLVPGHLKHFCGPVPWLAPLMFPIEVVSHLARVLSLSLRLFGNMFAGHILLAVIFLLTGLGGLFGWALTGKLGGILLGVPGGAILIAFTVGFLLPLKILVALLQAFVFCLLSMVYISSAVEDTEHH